MITKSTGSFVNIELVNAKWKEDLFPVLCDTYHHNLVVEFDEMLDELELTEH